MHDEVFAVDLSVQLSIAATFIGAMVAIHSAGLVSISRVLHVRDDKRIPKGFGLRAATLMGSYGLCLFALHFLEILIFACFFRYVGGLRTIEEALYYSASNYVTLGAVSANFAEKWRLVGALEALIGSILVGWTIAFMVGALRRILRIADVPPPRMKT